MTDLEAELLIDLIEQGAALAVPSSSSAPLLADLGQYVFSKGLGFYAEHRSFDYRDKQYFVTHRFVGAWLSLLRQWLPYSSKEVKLLADHQPLAEGYHDLM